MIISYNNLIKALKREGELLKRFVKEGYNNVSIQKGPQPINLNKGTF